MGEFRMPSLGADMDEGTLIEWHVAEGDVVHRGEVIAVVDTVKSAIEIEVFEDGVVEELLVAPGVTVAVGTPLARLRGLTESGQPPATRPTPPNVASPIVRHLAHERGVDLDVVAGSGVNGEITRADVESVIPPAPPPADTGAPDSPRVSPYARRRAQELGVALESVMASASDGVVTAADVEESAARSSRVGAPSPHEDSSSKLTAHEKQAAMRRAIGELMARSKREIPHYYLSTTIDMRNAMTWLQDANAHRALEERLIPAVLLLKAVAAAAKEVAGVNGYFKDGEFQPSDAVHLGVAVSLRGGGLIAPAIRDADQKTVEELMAVLKDLVSRARAGRLRGSEMTDPTITVTNLGDRGVESVTGVIYPPQVALVGFGRIAERPWAVDGMLGVHPLVTATLAADHRVTDGHRGGLFLAAVDDQLQRPEEL